MNKELLYQIIDNKINKIVYPYNNNFTDNDCKILISALKLNKSKNLTLDLSHVTYNMDNYQNLYKILNYLKNDKKFIKLNLSNCFQNINFNLKSTELFKISTNINRIKNIINNYDDIFYNQQINNYINNIKTNINQLNIIPIDTLINNQFTNLIYEILKNNSSLQSLNISNNENLYLCNFILKSIINNKNNTITSLNISRNGIYNNETFNLLSALLNKNVLTSLKLSFSTSDFKYYTEFKSLLKSIENNTSLQEIKIIMIDCQYNNPTINIMLLLLINSIIKNKNIKILKIHTDTTFVDIFNYLIINNKNLKTLKFTSRYVKCLYTLLYYDKEIIKNIKEDSKELNSYIKNYYDNCLLDITNKYMFNIQDITDIKHYFKNILDNLIIENNNIFKNFKYDHFIFNEMYKKLSNYYKSGSYTLSGLSMKEYINIIKNLNLNEKDDNCKNYYKLLKDKLSSINIIDNNEK